MGAAEEAVAGAFVQKYDDTIGDTENGTWWGAYPREAARDAVQAIRHTLAGPDGRRVAEDLGMWVGGWLGKDSYDFVPDHAYWSSDVHGALDEFDALFRLPRHQEPFRCLACEDAPLGQGTLHDPDCPWHQAQEGTDA